MAGALFTCPFDVIKTRLQSSKRNKMKSMFVPRMMHHIYKTEGLKALWKGIGPNLLGVIPARAIYFTVYSQTKQKVSNYTNIENLVYITSAIAAGVVTSLTTNPLWMIKTRMQLQSKKTYNNSFDCLQKVCKHEGFFALYRGLTASLIGISESTIQWLVYEDMKQRFEYPTSPFINAAFSKLIAALIAYPHEVVRTRMRERNQNLSFLQTFLQIRKEGLRAMYGGLGPHLMRVVPNSAITFLCYETMVYLL